MELDDVDRRLIRAVLEDASRSLRALGEAVGVSAPTVASRLERLETLGLLGPTRRQADLARLGTLVLVLAPPEDRQALVEHDRVFEVHKSQQNRAVALALLERLEQLSELHDAFPRAETHILVERVHASTPPFTGREVQARCDECGKAIEGDEGIEVPLGDDRYLVCCPTCEQAITERYERHASEG